jgi:2,3-bisphosphoglycerate-independent phosphoglycerate mutase
MPPIMTEAKRPRPVVLCILDGWGCRADRADNGIKLAKTPNWERIIAASPHARLQASESFVGLPTGQMGNSEVGHMNIGAGRVVTQDLPRIDKAVAEGALATNPQLQEFVAKLKASHGTAHLMGLISPGGVHSHQDHIAALALRLADAGVPVAVHAFLDGRDTPPRSAKDYVAKFARDVATHGAVRVASVSGRYYAMDRDKRWDRVVKAYAALVEGKGERAANATDAIERSYAAGQGDEFVLPTVIGAYGGMKDGDGVLCGNFRADRVREILAALLDPNFSGFARDRVVRFAAAAGLTEYSSELNPFLATLFPPLDLSDTFGEIVAKAGLHQLRIAETEKYAHVTFFFNGGQETLFPGEERILVPSPKVATYDLQPEMSAPEVTDRLVEAIEGGRFDVVVLNYANADMVGHTGDLDAAIKAVEAVDAALGRLSAAVEKADGALLITADHGNVEMMRDPETHQPHTAHTINPVPLILFRPPAGVTGLADGSLADIAPTLLAVLGLEQPEAMTGHSLLRAAAGAQSSAPPRGRHASA